MRLLSGPNNRTLIKAQWEDGHHTLPHFLLMSLAVYSFCFLGSQLLETELELCPRDIM